MPKQWEERLRDVVEQVTLQETAREHMLEACAVKRKAAARKKAWMKLAASASLVCILLFFPWGIRQEENGTAVVYASTGEDEWSRLEIGEKKLLVQTDKLGMKYCIFKLELQENYLFEQEFTMIGEDFISIKNGKIYWRIGEEGNDEDEKGERPESRRASMRIRILDKEGKRVDTLELEMTKEGEVCYAELRRIQ